MAERPGHGGPDEAQSTIRGSGGPAEGDAEDGAASTSDYATPSPIGAGDTPNVAGSNEQQPHLAAEPSPGLEPEEESGAREPKSPIVSVDQADTAGRGADGEVAARRAQKDRGGP